jgi:hypothetical protein
MLGSHFSTFSIRVALAECGMVVRDESAAHSSWDFSLSIIVASKESNGSISGRLVVVQLDEGLQRSSALTSAICFEAHTHIHRISRRCVVISAATPPSVRTAHTQERGTLTRRGDNSVLKVGVVEDCRLLSLDLIFDLSYHIGHSHPPWW